MDETISPTGKKGRTSDTNSTNLLPSTRQTTWILLNGPRPVDDQTKAWVEQFRQRVPELKQAAQLANEFILLLREQRSNELSNWLAQAAEGPLASFAAGLRRDLAAVQMAFSSPWSQGQVEGPGQPPEVAEAANVWSRQLPTLAKPSLSSAKSQAKDCIRCGLTRSTKSAADPQLVFGEQEATSRFSPLPASKLGRIRWLELQFPDTSGRLGHRNRKPVFSDRNAEQSKISIGGHQRRVFEARDRKRSPYRVPCFRVNTDSPDVQ